MSSNLLLTLSFKHPNHQHVFSMGKYTQSTEKENEIRPEWSDFGFTVCYSNLVFVFDANA